MGKLLTTAAAVLVLFPSFLSCAAAQNASSRRPNILFILMDDLGFSDVGFTDSRFHTPVLDRLRNGDHAIRFNRSYTPPNCGPSRAALLSGVYPWRMRLQGNSINSKSSAAIPPGKTILPQAFKSLGYETHLVGKWHQGFCKRSQTPTERGFDSFFGFYLTKQDHFSHFSKKDSFDFRSDLNVNKSVQGQYSTYIYTERVRQLLREYKDSRDVNPDDTKPFFIMLSHAAIHSPNQVPKHYITDYCENVIKDKLRRQKCGMMAAVDEGLRNITDDLKSLDLMDNLLIVFTSDDGGKTDEGSSNWPLRGCKRTLWEGGIRVHTFLYSEDTNVLPKTDFTYTGLFYNTDFYATLLGLVTDNTSSKKYPNIKDSYNLWRFLKAGYRHRSHRKSIVYVDQQLDVAMLMEGKLKLLRNQKRNPDWYNPPPGAKAPKPTEGLDDISTYQLFNLDDDPVEAHNVKDMYPETTQNMSRTLRRVRGDVRFPIDEEMDSDPKKYGYVWSPGWC